MAGGLAEGEGGAVPLGQEEALPVEVALAGALLEALPVAHAVAALLEEGRVEVEAAGVGVGGAEAEALTAAVLLTQDEGLSAAEALGDALMEALPVADAEPALLPEGGGEEEAAGVGVGSAEKEALPVPVSVGVALPDSSRHVALLVAPVAKE